MEKKIRVDIIKTRNIWFILSMVVTIAGVISLFTLKLNYGIDFTGGQIIGFEAGRKVNTDEIDQILQKNGLRFMPAQILSGGKQFVVRISSYGTAAELKKMTREQRDKKEIEYLDKTKQVKIDFNLEFHKINPEKFVLFGLSTEPTQESLGEALKKAKSKFNADGIEILKVTQEERKSSEEPITFKATLNLGQTDQESSKALAKDLYEGLGEGYRQFTQEYKIDPVFGVELQKKAFIALIIAALLIMVYVTIRYEFYFALAAVVALLHDCLITLGFYSIFQLEVDSTFVAVILTIFGYSINDTIIIFDRIRENMRKHKKMPLSKIMNLSIWETMARSINTVVTVEITLLALLFLGGASLKQFSLGLALGIASGCYSSILVATPLVFLMKTRGKEEEVAKAPESKKATKKEAKAASSPAKEKSAATTDGDSSDDKAAASGASKKKGGGKQRRR